MIINKFFIRLNTIFIHCRDSYIIVIDMTFFYRISLFCHHSDINVTRSS